MFWAISAGIVCGTRLYHVAIIVSVFVTLAIVLLELLPNVKESRLLVINAKDPDVEKALCEVISKYTKKYSIQSRNLTPDSMDMIIRVNLKENEAALVKEIQALEQICTVALLSHEGEIGV